MTIFLSVLAIYISGAALAAPRLMRLLYQDKLAIMAHRQARHEEKMAEWRANKDRSAFNMPLLHSYDTELSCRREAQLEGFWWSLVWPASLAFHSLGRTAFKQEIAAQQSKQNTKIIADYEKLLAESFDRELATFSPDPRAAAARKLIRTLTRKEHS